MNSLRMNRAIKLIPTVRCAGDFVLEINSAQPCCIWARGTDGVTFGVLPLPDSEGAYEAMSEHWSEPDSTKHSGGYARAADVLVRDGSIWVVLANFNGRNTAYEVPVSLFDGCNSPAATRLNKLTRPPLLN